MQIVSSIFVFQHVINRTGRFYMAKKSFPDWEQRIPDFWATLDREGYRFIDRGGSHIEIYHIW